MLARSILITGCNRGLGLELVRQLIPQTENLIATCRNLENASDLRELADENENLKLLPLDVRDHNCFADFTEEISSMIGSEGLNLFINNAGVSPKSTRINFVTPQQMEETFLVNCISPLMLTKALLPLLKQAAASDPDENFRIPHAAVVNISSILGSLTSNEGERSGGLYPYRCSKAALNMVTRSLSSDLAAHNITVVSMHPGWVRTDMGGPNAPLSANESIETMIATLQELRPEHSGHFFNYDGEPLPW